MAYRRIDPEVIEEIEHLLRTTDLSCRQIAAETGVSRRVVNRLNSRGPLATQRMPTRLDRHCSGCGAKLRPNGKDVCLACETGRQQRQDTLDEDVSLSLDLAEEHKGGYEEMRAFARARHEARDKKPEIGT